MRQSAPILQNHTRYLFYLGSNVKVCSEEFPVLVRGRLLHATDAERESRQDAAACTKKGGGNSLREELLLGLGATLGTLLDVAHFPHRFGD